VVTAMGPGRSSLKPLPAPKRNLLPRPLTEIPGLKTKIKG